MQTDQTLDVVPLGGLGEFGMHMMAFRSNGSIIVVDAGIMFPDEELLGVDIIVPDITYLLENKSEVRAIFLTHGHEDHIGALPFILPYLNLHVFDPAPSISDRSGKTIRAARQFSGTADEREHRHCRKTRLSESPTGASH